MKKTLVVLSGLTISALLTGCGTSISAEDQARLIEYENCLTWERDAWFSGKPDGSLTASTLEYYKSRAYQDGSRLIPDYFLENCQKYRP
jgi:hypothetical protein